MSTHWWIATVECNRSGCGETFEAGADTQKTAQKEVLEQLYQHGRLAHDSKISLANLKLFTDIKWDEVSAPSS